MLSDKGQEHIVRVIESAGRFLVYRIHVLLRGQKRLLMRRIAVLQQFHRRALAGRHSVIVLLLDGGPGDILQIARVEGDWRRCEYIKHKNHGPGQQNEELHRNLGHCIEKQTHPALLQVLTRQIALHLALVASKVSEGQKRASDDSAEQVVSVVPVEIRGDCVQLAGACCE